MKIGGYHTNKTGSLIRISARVEWEDCGRPQRDIYIETDAKYEEDLSCNPHTFLLAAIIPAMRHGERRVSIEGKVCPQLRNGLTTAMQQLKDWYGEKRHRPVEIEATRGFAPTMPQPRQHTASFLSGGVDAIATIRSNRLDFPLDHPGAVRTSFLIHGVDIGGYENAEKKERNFLLAVKHLSAFAIEAQTELIALRFNFRHLDDTDELFAMEAHGAMLAAVAHAFASRISTALIASTYPIADLAPWGSHPLLDANYSSSDVAIRHDCVRYTRMEKLSLISQWQPALDNLRSCFDPFRPDDALNCGTCEKCLRTMVGLLLCGKLEACRTYPSDISPEHLESIVSTRPERWPEDLKAASHLGCRMLTVGNANYWRELKVSLEKAGRQDLSTVVAKKLREYDNYLARLEGRPWKRLLKRLDRRYLGGRLKKIVKRVRQR